MLLQQCNLATIKTFHGKPAQERYGYSNGDEQILLLKGSAMQELPISQSHERVGSGDKTTAIPSTTCKDLYKV